MWNSGSSTRIHLINTCRIIHVSQILFSSEIPLKNWSKCNYNIGQFCLDDTENIKALQIMAMKQRELTVVMNQTGSLQISFSAKWLHNMDECSFGDGTLQWKDTFHYLSVILVQEVVWGLDRYVQDLWILWARCSEEIGDRETPDQSTLDFMSPGVLLWN